ncbi:hypothetical protein FHX42_002027 [Saccharopolyspora lacisalsi]|uniref:SAM-dependent chlorinase/fluorinase n=1 Tax=Halosaccharopolyspora lacisalsi TaxID=1000566 RepID=A0A839DUU1_9PSEU|nr:SAM-dependent chlorinase/fluorinase [Halosaccharopolyspora lacisalsi]MBA8824680.1 hypothetical protein [Halosaccharopolyspora lacisalsi]
MQQPGYGWVSLTTDYGHQDGFVAACHGVLARIAPHARTLDVTHTVPAQAITVAATVLAHTVNYLPEAVHLVVVDPGVGTDRRGVVVDTDRGTLVGPDNGVLIPAADALGGARAAFELTDSRWWLPAVSRTFHGRDIFAPVAAWLARGTDPAETGPPLDLDELRRPPEPHRHVDGDSVHAEVITIDHFGNLQLAVDAADVRWPVGQWLHIHTDQAVIRAQRVATFADVADQQPLVLADSAGALAVAVNGGSAAEKLATGRGRILRIEPAEPPTEPQGA